MLPPCHVENLGPSQSSAPSDKHRRVLAVVQNPPIVDKRPVDLEEGPQPGLPSPPHDRLRYVVASGRHARRYPGECEFGTVEGDKSQPNVVSGFPPRRDGTDEAPAGQVGLQAKGAAGIYELPQLGEEDPTVAGAAARTRASTTP